MSNERYWIFHEWVRKHYILPDGYMPKVWDSLAFSYWFNEKDDYYLQFENKTKEDNEIDLFKNFGNSKSDVDFIKEYAKMIFSHKTKQCPHSQQKKVGRGSTDTAKRNSPISQ